MARKGKVSRKTKETSINVEVNIDGKGKYQIDSGIGFLDQEQYVYELIIFTFKNLLIYLLSKSAKFKILMKSNILI